MMDRIVHSRRQPAASRNRRSTAMPCSVCMTSGWNCTPYSPRPRSSMAATAVTAVPAVTVKPGGAATAQSPCDIHTCCGLGSPVSSVAAAPGGASRSSRVAPYSPIPVLATAPPRPDTMSWNP